MVLYELLAQKGTYIDILLGLAMNGSDNNEYRKVLYVNLGSCDHVCLLNGSIGHT